MMEAMRHLATRVPSPFSPWAKEPRAEAVGERARKTRFLQALFLSISLLAPMPSHAISPSEMLDDPKLEARARAIASELRCLVCQNQSIDDSDAPLAKDLRGIVREKLKEGASDEDVRNFLVSRYGDFVLLRPPVKPETLLLWAAPLIALVGGGSAIFLALRRKRREEEEAEALTQEERAQLAALGVAAAPPPQSSPAARESE
jgi:cytochrome c-type biogenesis protein CcmH